MQRTPLVTSKGHTHPVYALQQVGTVNATNLVSVSTDGKLCVWNLNMLVHPQETLDLKKANKELVVHTLAFPPNETNVLWAGSEDGGISQIQIHGAGSKNGVVDSLEGHEGPVLGVFFCGVFAALLLPLSLSLSLPLSFSAQEGVGVILRRVAFSTFRRVDEESGWNG